MANPKKDAKTPNKSPAKAAGVTKTTVSPSKYSPSRNRCSKKEVMQAQKLPQGWHLRSSLCQGDIEVVLINLSDLQNDAYFQPMVNAIANKTLPEYLKEHGLMGAFFCCKSVAENSPLHQPRSNFQSRCLVHFLEPEETTPAACLQALESIKKFLEEKDNNKYETPIHIMDPGWDITPKTGIPPKLDHFLQYGEVMKVLHLLYEGIDATWAVENKDNADLFFTPGYIPFKAHEELGYPIEEVVPKADN